MVRIGFVGTGGIAAHHMEQLKKVEEARIVALCDIVEERAREASARFGGKAYGDHRRMIEAEGLDALYVCIPPGAHTDAEILAARKGIHLFVEKPVTLDPDLGLRILQEIRKAGVFSSVGYSLRYIPAARAMRDFLKDKTIAMVTSNRWGGVPETPWWRVMAQSGGQLVEQTTHQVDLMRYLAGDVVEVHARYARRAIGHLPNATIPDVQVVNFLFSSGAIGNLSTSCALTRGGGKSDLTVILRDMTIGYGREVTVTPPGAASIRVPPDPIPDIDASFIQAIRSGNPSWIESSYEDGLKSAIVCLAANRSADTGRPVGIEKGGLGILDPG